MKMRPLHDRVIVKRMEEERTSPGGSWIRKRSAPFSTWASGMNTWSAGRGSSLLCGEKTFDAVGLSMGREGLGDSASAQPAKRASSAANAARVVGSLVIRILGFRPGNKVSCRIVLEKLRRIPIISTPCGRVLNAFGPKAEKIRF